MEQKIQELTNKLYLEGVEKGEAEAKKIIAEAQQKASSIISEAKTTAEKIIAEAKSQAEELKRNTESEIRLASMQALSAIKQKIVELITTNVIDDAVSKTLSEPSTIKELVSLIVQNWKSEQSGAVNLEVLLPVNKQEELKKAFEKGAADLLKKGLVLRYSDSIKNGFRIGPVDGAYKISLTDEDFKEFIKDFLRPKTRKWLFGE
ncbi:MAG: hypothetical protein N2053_09040 [Chitinispirillaceae bacterium]|nr:hypothetical protein [Chitinispirillaceae bacterium]